MEIKSPSVTVLAYTESIIANMRSEIVHITKEPDFKEEWFEAGDPDELLIQYAGRRCYNSFLPGINKNVKKIRQDSGEYIQNIVSSKHGSVLEHVSISFAIENVTRVFTAELERHRAGIAYSEQSLRYVRLDNLVTWMPPEIEEDADLSLIFKDTFSSIEKSVEEMYRRVAFIHDVEEFSDLPMDVKKKYTSAIRRIVPMGICTGVVWTANLRALRHIIPLRTAKSAETEIRIIFLEIGRIVKDLYPNVFADMTLKNNEEWIVEHEKV